MKRFLRSIVFFVMSAPPFFAQGYANPLSISVIVPIGLGCDAVSLTMIAPASGSHPNSGKPVTCTINNGAIAWNEMLWQAEMAGNLTASGQTLLANAIGVSSSSSGPFSALSVTEWTTIADNTSGGSALPSTFTFYVNATIGSGQAAATYTGTMEIQLTVTYTP